jgi:hypothetical protein
LGKLDATELAGLGGRREDQPALLRGETPYTPPVTTPLPSFAATDQAAAAGWAQADLRALRVERSRDFGECYLAPSLLHRLGMDQFLGELLPTGRESVGWAHPAALLTAAQFCAHRS